MARLLNTKVIRAPGPAHLSPGEHLDFTTDELAAFKLVAAAVVHHGQILDILSQNFCMNFECIASISSVS